VAGAASTNGRKTAPGLRFGHDRLNVGRVSPQGLTRHPHLRTKPSMFSSMSGYAALTRLTGLCEGVKSLIAVKVAQPGEYPRKMASPTAQAAAPRFRPGDG